MHSGERYRRSVPQETIEILTEPKPLMMPEGEVSGQVVGDDGPVEMVKTMTISGLNEGYERTLAVAYIEREFNQVN